MYIIIASGAPAARASRADEDAPPRLRREGGGDALVEKMLSATFYCHQRGVVAATSTARRGAGARPRPRRLRVARPRRPAAAAAAARGGAARALALRLDNFIYEDEAADAELKSIDFGFAVDVAPGVGGDAEQIGTPSYMAPELWADHAKSYELVGPPPHLHARPRKRATRARPPPRPRPPSAAALTRPPCPLLQVDMWAIGVVTYSLLSRRSGRSTTRCAPRRRG